MQKLFSWFIPPHYVDEQKSREAKFAHYISLALAVGLLYAIVHRLWFFSIEQSYILLVIEIITILLFFLNVFKILPSPLLFHVFFAIVAATGLMIMSDGTRDEILLIFPVSLFYASLAFRRKLLIIVLCAELAILWILGILEMNGYLRNQFSHTSNYYHLIILSLILIFSVYIIDLIVVDFKTFISDLKVKSYEIAEANNELHKSNATKDKFFSIVAHDLRSPFQGLLGIANILESLDDELKSEERKDFVSRLNIALKRQYDFLEELLLWGKIQRNAIDFEPEICDLREIVERNSEILSGNIYKKKLQFKIDGPEVVNARCDENLISTVIRNLISNAIKYTPAGGSLTVTFQDLPKTVIVNVIDTGIGLSEKRKEQLFLIESNYSTRGTENEVGTGLGLILCKEIVDRHNGTISVLSEEGKGSTFCIQLPKNLL